MTLMETLILAENSDLLEEILAKFPVDKERIMGIDVTGWNLMKTW